MEEQDFLPPAAACKQNKLSFEATFTLARGSSSTTCVLLSPKTCEYDSNESDPESHRVMDSYDPLSGMPCCYGQDIPRQRRTSDRLARLLRNGIRSHICAGKMGGPSFHGGRPEG